MYIMCSKFIHHFYSVVKKSTQFSACRNITKSDAYLRFLKIFLTFKAFISNTIQPIYNSLPRYFIHVFVGGSVFICGKSPTRMINKNEIYLKSTDSIISNIFFYFRLGCCTNWRTVTYMWCYLCWSNIYMISSISRTIL